MKTCLSVLSACATCGDTPPSSAAHMQYDQLKGPALVVYGLGEDLPQRAQRLCHLWGHASIQSCTHALSLDEDQPQRAQRLCHLWRHPSTQSCAHVLLFDDGAYSMLCMMSMKTCRSVPSAWATCGDTPPSRAAHMHHDQEPSAQDCSSSQAPQRNVHTGDINSLTHCDSLA